LNKQRLVRRVVATAFAFALTLASSASPSAAAAGGTAQAGFTTPLELPGSAGFGEPSIISGSGRLVVTAPNGLLTTATAGDETNGTNLFFTKEQ
jgi:hypothetical protein